MRFTVYREELLKPLQLLTGIVEKRHTLPILANVLIKADQHLYITATDLEVELLVKIIPQTPVRTPGQITVPGRKLLDICRSFPEGTIELYCDKDKMILESGSSRYSLATLPGTDFPAIQNIDNALEFSTQQKNLRYLTQRTHFAMAQQDVRSYLNGMLLEVNQGVIRAVATDGHRLALNAVAASIINNNFTQVIIPRKGVIELGRLLEDSNEEIMVSVTSNHIRVTGPTFIFTSKLIEGRFPNYDKVLPKGGDKIITVPRETFKQALSRASILSNEKLRGIRLQLRKGLLRIIANNPEQEEAQEEIPVEYFAGDLDIGFNVKYLTDILDTLDDEQVVLTLSGSDSSILVEGNQGEGNSLFVVMPMRL